MNKVYRNLLMGAIGLMMLPQTMMADTSILDLKVQDTARPMAIEDQHPTFSWRMESTERGMRQTAYRIIVTRDSDGSKLWDSGKVSSGLSSQIKYMGVGLQPENSYSWNVEVWDQNGKSYTSSSTFETSLLSTKLSAWNGAKWVGSKVLRLDAASNNYFEIKTRFRLVKGDKVSLILGANDFRFNDAFQNIGSAQGENYFRIEFDLSAVGTAKGAVLNIYRVGYLKTDKKDKPIISVNLADYPDTNINELLTSANKNQEHELSMLVETSNISFQIDGKDLISTKPRQFGRPGGGGGGFAVGNVGGQVRNASKMQIGIYGSSHNENTTPNLAEVGFAAIPGSEVIYSDYQILNCGQAQDNVVFNQKHYDIFRNMTNVQVQGNEIRVSDPGKMMSISYADPSHDGLTLLRTTFEAAKDKTIKKARLYATAMGSYEAYINGKRMGEDWFAPGDSQYRETMGYHAYDVTSYLQSGKNAIGVQLSPGWYTGAMTFTSSNYNFFGDYEAFLMKLVITYSDGSKETIVTDPSSWKAYNDGPVRFGNFFQGERYDARKEANIDGYATAGYNDSKWHQADLIQQRDWVNFDLMARYDEPVRQREVLTAIQEMPVHSADGHTYTYNMGVNMVGVPSISIPEGYLKEGDVVIIRYGEMLYPGFKNDAKEYQKLYGAKGKNIAGRILYETYRAALATDFYIAKDSKAVTIQPSTTYRGYQYIQITLPSHQGALPLSSVKGLVLSSDKLQTGTYTATTSDGTTGDLINQLFKNIQRSQLGNFFTIPTDCPQRNERMGWTGDAQAYTRTSTFNSDTQNFMRQWMVALRADQGVGNDVNVPGGIGSTVPTYNKADDTSFADGTTWAAAVCQVPWQLYIQYGNTQIIEENIEAMMMWLNGMDFYDFSDKYTYLSSKASGLADWLAMDNRTPSDLVNNAIYIHMMDCTAKMARAINRVDYAEILEARRQKAIEEWNDCYVDPSTGKTRDSKGNLIHSQASYATPLNFNCFNEANKAKAEEWLSKLAQNPSSSGDGSTKYPAYTITTGFSGTPNILPSLSRAGRVEDAYRMFTCKDYTSWLYPVTMGATSVWERWNGYEGAFQERNQNSMNSFNHFALGAVGQWMYEYQLGITSNYEGGEAGYKHFILQPTVGSNYTALQGSYDSTYGTIKSAMKADGKGHMTSYECLVPANTTATVYIPTAASNGSSIQGASCKGAVKHNGVDCLCYELESGSYSFSISDSSVSVR